MAFLGPGSEWFWAALQLKAGCYRLVPMDLTDLYRGPIEEFVARRTRLVRETRPNNPSAAQAIGKIRKPSVSVWAIDQLSIDQQQLLMELLAAGADAGEAQRAVAGQLETRETLL